MLNKADFNMERIINILDYLYQKYPNSNQLSYSRVMKLLYLIEWKFVITNFKKLTDIEWVLSPYGPFHKNLRSIFNESSNFDVSIRFDYNNKEQLLIKFLNKKEKLNINSGVVKIVDFVINHCKDLSWNELNNLVNSTYGILNTKDGQIIDIVRLAKEYKDKI